MATRSAGPAARRALHAAAILGAAAVVAAATAFLTGVVRYRTVARDLAAKISDEARRAEVLNFLK